MQRDMKKRVVLFDIALILFALLLVSLYYGLGDTHQASTQTSPEVTVGPSIGPNISPSNGPMIFATVSFPSESGFVTVVHPTSGTTEFVLLPNSVGQITVLYTSSNNLTMPVFMFPLTHPVPAFKVNLSNGTLGADSGLIVTTSSITWISIHQVDVNYTVTSASGADNGLYVLGLPSTIFSTIVNVGAQAYTGPLTWLNGKVYN